VIRLLATAVALVAGVWAIWILETARAGLDLTQFAVGPTPVTRMSDGSGGPPVVIAHGFAGSRQMMSGYAQVLAQAGYTVHVFDFVGHGRHPLPMSGDPAAVEGTTRLLVDQTRTVIDAARQGTVPVALIGHSMATDVLVRVAAETEGIGPIALLSAFSTAIDAGFPPDLLLVTGAWEPGLTQFAIEAAQMVDPAARAGQTVTDGAIRRRAVLAPAVEHVAILHSRAGRVEVLDWLNAAYDRTRTAPVPQTGWALLTLLAALTALTAPMARLLPQAPPEKPRLGAGRFALVVFCPALAAPLLASPLDTRLLPVLVADYLVLHLALYGAVQLGLLVWLRGSLPRIGVMAACVLVVWALAGFGLGLDRYGANFVPVGQRIWIIAALTLGTVPFMLADTWVVAGAPIWQSILARAAFLGSLGIAVALDFEGLFFLLMIAPVILLFWLTFGIMGRFVSARAGAGAAGLGLGLILAWALGVSFPLFQT
jgi:alpha-beta hydrolase superfamily lysophospholipase